MQTLGDRIKYIVEVQGDNLRSFSEKSKIDYSSLSDLTRNKRNLGGILLLRLAEYLPDLNLNWLFLGNGHPWLGKNAELAEMGNLREPQPEYAKHDPGEEMFLNYLDRPSVQEKLKLILKGK